MVVEAKELVAATGWPPFALIAAGVLLALLLTPDAFTWRSGSASI